MNAVRMFLPAMPFRPWNFSDWGNIGFEYFRGFIEENIQVRLISSYPVDLYDPRWTKYGNFFTNALPEHWVNVVVGPEFDRCWTTGRWNVAITGGKHSCDLSKYDIIINPHDLTVKPGELWKYIQSVRTI